MVAIDASASVAHRFSTQLRTFRPTILGVRYIHHPTSLRTVLDVKGPFSRETVHFSLSNVSLWH